MSDKTTTERHKILVIGKLPPQFRAALNAAYALVERDSVDGPAAGFEVAATTSMDGASAAVMGAIPDLKLILCNGAGLDAVDVPEAERRGIVVRNTPDAVTVDTAEFAIGLIFALGRRIVESDRFVRDGRWGPERMTAGDRIAGRSLGIVGMGRIGKTIAAHAAALGMTVRYNARSAKSDLPYGFDADVGALAAASDILVLALAAGPDSLNLIDAAVLEKLGPKGLLINVARGSVVDERALLDALRDKTIAGAALDVFAQEPGLNPVFRDLTNAILTPHYAAATVQTRQAMADELRQTADDFYAAGPVA